MADHRIMTEIAKAPRLEGAAKITPARSTSNVRIPPKKNTCLRAQFSSKTPSPR